MMTPSCVRSFKRTLPALSALIIAGLPLTASAQTQCEWVERNAYGRWSRHTNNGIAYDSHRQRTVIVSGFQTWEWHEDGWFRVFTNPSPPSRFAHAMAYDEVRQRTVLFGGLRTFSPSTLGDTWVYDGTTWTQAAAAGPSARYEHAIGFDSVRQRVVLFGGLASTVGPALADTWEWDGTDWMQSTPAASPPARHGHAMTFDDARGRMVIFGGRGETELLGDTWEWDGNTWHLAAAPAPANPSARHGHRMVFDRARQQTVLFAGEDASGRIGDTWAWDGTAWAQQSPATVPDARAFHAMVYQEHAGGGAGRILMAGGSTGPTFEHLPRDTWEWDGHDWRLRTKPGPGARILHSVLYDTVRDETLVVNGEFAEPEGAVWGWNGEVWRRHTRGGGPGHQYYHAAAFDTARGQIVLFGGTGTSTSTWTWNAQGWTEHNVPGPSPRLWPAMAYDAVRDRTVLSGGWFNQQNLTDTWEWDGTQWQQIGVPGGGGGLMTFDSIAGRIIKVAQGGTFAYDGAAWVQLTDGSIVNQATAIAFDPVRNRTVIFGMGNWAMNQTWEFDGEVWSQIPISGPRGRDMTGRAWDARRERIVLFGGNAEGRTIPMDDTWELVCQTLPPLPCYANCDGSTAQPLLNIDDFGCFINMFAAAVTLPHAQQVLSYANCDGSTIAPVLNIDDFTCFINQFARGCR
jgi:hypothetical protein